MENDLELISITADTWNYSFVFMYKNHILLFNEHIHLTRVLDTKFASKSSSIYGDEIAHGNLQHSGTTAGSSTKGVQRRRTQKSPTLLSN